MWQVEDSLLGGTTEYDANINNKDYWGATSVHVTKHLYGVRLRDLVYMTSIYMK